MKNLVHIDKDFGWFIGNFDHNQKHQHYAIQLSIPIHGSVSIQTESEIITTELPILIKTNVIHQLTSEEDHLLILINPASTIGHFYSKSVQNDITEFIESPATDLQKIIKGTEKLSSEPSALKKEINKLITSYDCFCGSFIHQGDERINKALAFLQENASRTVPLEEMAHHCNISQSRFRHLFKDQTGLTYRRVQLWTRLVKAIPLMRNQSLTEVAYSAGFSDSAHFSRTFRENFGFSPREFLKISRFIQV